MIVYINDPLVVSCTYYNTTGILADNGKKDSNYPATFNSKFGVDVVTNNDFNTELLFIDYQKPDWTTFNSIPQTGDKIINSKGDPVFYGIMDYNETPLYMIKPLQDDSYPITRSNTTIDKQEWDFDNSSNYTWADSSKQADLRTYMKELKSEKLSPNGDIEKWRTGTSTGTKPDPVFMPSWVQSGDTAETDTLTVAAFNLENYTNKGGSYSKNEEVANIIVNNLGNPDVLIVIEMGDDNDTPVVYDNQADSWAYKDGVVSAVENYRDLISKINSVTGHGDYDFRQIDPKEQDSGGAPGNNIRVGFLFNRNRVEFVDSGMVTNHLDNTTGVSSTWPLQAPSEEADLLADIDARVYRNNSVPHLSQSPGYIQDESFKGSRRPLCGEFKFKETGETFFVVACHLSSKTGDGPIYGEIQPSLLGSETKRTDQAQAVNSFVKQILAINKNAKVIVAGDMNEFGYATPIKALTGELGGNQILFSPSEEFMPVNEQFSYCFNGNYQQIDHIFVSKSIYSEIEVAGEANWEDICYIPHINSMVSRNNNINTSDHDPEIVRLKGAF